MRPAPKAHLKQKTLGPLKYLPGLTQSDNDTIMLINTKDVHYIAIDDGVIRAFLPNGSFKIRRIRSLNQLIEKLDNKCFFRANRSTVVQIQKIVRIKLFPKGRCRIELADSKEVMLSELGKTTLLNTLEWTKWGEE